MVKLPVWIEEEIMQTKRIFVLSIAFVFMLSSMVYAQRKGPTGSANRSFGPQGGVQAEGSRSVKGPKAESSFSAEGPQGHSVSGTATSAVAGGKAKGEATVQTSGGKSLTAEGQGSVSAGGASGSGSVNTGTGKGAT
jgi:hypothetical protein